METIQRTSIFILIALAIGFFIGLSIGRGGLEEAERNLQAAEDRVESLNAGLVAAEKRLDRLTTELKRARADLTSAAENNRELREHLERERGRIEELISGVGKAEDRATGVAGLASEGEGLIDSLLQKGSP